MAIGQDDFVVTRADGQVPRHLSARELGDLCLEAGWDIVQDNAGIVWRDMPRFWFLPAYDGSESLAHEGADTWDEVVTRGWLDGTPWSPCANDEKDDDDE